MFNAKEIFESLGYKQIMYEDKENPLNEGIQYVKNDPESEIQRVGMVNKKVIEFYTTTKEICIYGETTFRSGKKKPFESVGLTLDEFNAVQKQVHELIW